VFAPESDGFTVTGPLQTPRDSHTATVLDDGSVLFIGGTYNRATIIGFPLRCVHSSTVLTSAELYK
jgi:hypothetical protein